MSVQVAGRPRPSETSPQVACGAALKALSHCPRQAGLLREPLRKNVGLRLTDPHELIQAARRRGISVNLLGNKIEISSPKVPDDDAQALISQLREYREEIRAALAEAHDDPILNPDSWYPIFHQYHRQAVMETPGFDYIWVRKNCPVLYARLKEAERRIETLEAVPLSQLMVELKAWRNILLEAILEQRKAKKRAA